MPIYTSSYLVVWYSETKVVYIRFRHRQNKMAIPADPVEYGTRISPWEAKPPDNY
jgi:hypothetical protein